MGVWMCVFSLKVPALWRREAPPWRFAHWASLLQKKWCSLNPGTPNTSVHTFRRLLGSALCVINKEERSRTTCWPIRYGILPKSHFNSHLLPLCTRTFVTNEADSDSEQQEQTQRGSRVVSSRHHPSSQSPNDCWTWCFERRQKSSVTRR